MKASAGVQGPEGGSTESCASLTGVLRSCSVLTTPFLSTSYFLRVLGFDYGAEGYFRVLLCAA